MTPLERYERLRRIGAGEASESQYRDGLVLFLRQGMWRWACALDGRHTDTPYLATAAGTLSVPAQRTVVIHLLAQVAMATSSRRFQCR